jgi:hypothetical protein
VKANARFLVDSRSWAANVANDKRKTVAHRLENDVAARFTITWENENVCGSVEGADLFARNPAMEVHTPAKTELRGQCLAFCSVEAVADDIQHDR